MAGGGRRVSSSSMRSGRSGSSNGSSSSGARSGLGAENIEDAVRGMRDQVVPRARAVANRMRAWWLLIPVPLLFIALIIKAFSLNILGLLTIGFAIFALLQGWVFIRNGMGVAAADQNRHLVPGRFPWRLIGALLIGAAAFALAFVYATDAGDGVFARLVQALFANLFVTGALVMVFGFDKIAAQGIAEAAKEAGMPKSDLVKAFNQAHGKIDGLERAASATTDPGFREQMFDIAASARRIVLEIERDPKDLRRSRRFLATYLDSATRIAKDFQANQTRLGETAIKAKYAGLLGTILETFAEQEDKLAKHDDLDLDVRIEVLKTQMEREGL